MAYGGDLTYRTILDTSGYQKGINDIEGKTKSGGSTVKNIIAGLGITKLISAAFNTIKSSMDDAINRLDTMRNFPKVMSNLGISTKESEKAINKLSEGLKGIPTTLDAGALAVQRFTSKNGDVDKSTDLFLALNNAILAGGANMQIQESALEQLSQAYAKGKPDMMEWRTVQMAMPAQLKQISTQMLGNRDSLELYLKKAREYANNNPLSSTANELVEQLEAVSNGTGDMTTALGTGLRTGVISMDEFMNTIMYMNKKGTKEFKSFEEQSRNATGGIRTNITNMKTAVVRGVANMIDSIDKAMSKKGLGTIGDNISKLGKKAEELLGKLGKQIPKIIDLITKAFSVLKKLYPVLIAVGAALVSYEATLLAIKGINMAASVVKMISAFIQLIPAIDTAKEAMVALNIATNANSIGIVIAGIAALTAAGLAFYHSQTEGIRKLDDEVKKSTESINEYVESYKAAKKTRDESLANDLSEISYYQNLANELKTIVDENGRIKEGYEERANFIVTTLNEALGLEIKITDGIVENIGEMNKAIDEHIEKMKVEAIMSAQKDLYEEAIKKRKTAVEELSKAEDEKAKQEKVLAEMEKEYNESYLKMLGPVRQEYQKQIKAQKERVEKAKENYNALQETTNGYYSTIKESEAMFEDYNNGHYDRLTALHYNYQDTMSEDVKVQKETLEKQIEQAKTDLDVLEGLKKQYNTNIYDDDIEATRKELEELQKRYNGIVGTTEEGEKKATDKAKKGLDDRLKNIKDKNPAFKDATGKNIDSSIEGMKEKGPIAEYEAGKIGEKAAKSMGNQKGKAQEAGGWLLDGLLGGLTDLTKQNTILRAVTGFAGRVLSTLKSGFQENSPSKASKQYGEWLLEGLNIGIDNEKKDVLDNIEDFSDDVVNRMASAVNMQAGKMAFSGTSGTVNQIMTATGTTTVINENKLLLDGDVVYENQKKVSAKKDLQTQFGGAYSVSN